MCRCRKRSMLVRDCLQLLRLRPQFQHLQLRLESRWWGRGDLNSHTLRHQILSLACLPISPRPHLLYGVTSHVASCETKALFGIGWHPLSMNVLRGLATLAEEQPRHCGTKPRTE